jgi:magnesium chelatase family protein
VLFLDELPEFNRNVLEVLRAPLEAGTLTISRANRQAEYAADFQLVAAMNPCPCGYLGDTQGDCGCSAERVTTYRSKVSGPLLDRIDLHIEVGRPPKEAMREKGPSGEPSATVARRIHKARELQLQRANRCNAKLVGDQLEEVCELCGNCLTMLEVAVDKFSLSARAYQRVRRVARTIADLAGAAAIEPRHVAEALSFRQLDKRVNRG